MKEEGWCECVCWDWEDAKNMIVWYLKQDRSHLFSAGGKIPTP